ncbi:MAG: replicative DNA helicase [Phycisphaerae bacterium]|nr:replicative DNA helicase [Phycisphaerae bacterium]
MSDWTTSDGPNRTPNRRSPTPESTAGPDRLRQPPQDLDAEMSLLGSMLLDAEVIGPVLQIISREESERLYHPDHRVIYRALVDLFDQGKPIDAIVMRDELARLGRLEQIGGVEYLVRLVESVPSAVNAEHYARIVRDKSLRRDVIRCASHIIEEAYGQQSPTELFLDDVEHRLFEVTEQRVRQRVLHLREFLEETFRQIESREGHVISGLPTGFTQLDELTSGLQPGELIIIAARPSMGKTALGLAFVEHIGAEENIPVAFFSMEMSKQMIAQRLLSSRGRVDAHRMRRGLISSEEMQHLALVCGDLCDKPIYVDDTPGMSVMELRAKARRLLQLHGVRCVFVDYLQLMQEPRISKDGNRQQEISFISRGLKALARELNIPVVALAQLNRDPEKREGNRPRMSDLRESGAIEQDADVVMLLHREDYYKPDDPDVQGKAELIIAKQRNGPTDTIEVFFDRRLTRFGNLHPAMAGGYEADAAAASFMPAEPDRGVPF